MAVLRDSFVNKIYNLEGRDIYTDDPDDRGGATKSGITLATWQSLGYDKNHDGHIDKEDIKILDMADLKLVMDHFWKGIKGELITSQSIAELWFDWSWASGAWATIKIQRILNLTADGIVGPKTIAAVNSYQTQENLFNLISMARIVFVENIISKDPSQAKFRTGWINRIKSFTFSD